MSKTREAFNANTQQLEDAEVTIDAHGEYLFTFSDGSFFKLPGDLDKDAVTEALAVYESANVGQVKAEDFEAANEAKLANI